MQTFKEYSESAVFPGLLDYSWKASKIRAHGRYDEVAYGFELEIEAKENPDWDNDHYSGCECLECSSRYRARHPGMSDEQYAQRRFRYLWPQVYQVCRKYLSGRFVMKPDGSLGDGGVEIVSSPLGLSWYQSDDCRLFLRELAKIATSHNNARCGLHFHASRTRLQRLHDRLKDNIRNDGAVDLAIDRAGKKLLAALNEVDLLVPITRRMNKDHIRRWASTDFDDRFDVSDGRQAYQTNDRYSALNCGKKTLELRVFRGTLKHTSFVSSVEFYDAMLGYIGASKSMDELNACGAKWNAFLDYCVDQEKYHHLADYLREKIQYFSAENDGEI